jgi:hypothetical protein
MNWQDFFRCEGTFILSDPSNFVRLEHEVNIIFLFLKFILLLILSNLFLHEQKITNGYGGWR